MLIVVGDVVCMLVGSAAASVKSLFAVGDGMYVVTGRGGAPEEKEQQLD